MFVPHEKHFRPRKFLKLAMQLIADRDYGDEPCRVRTSVGRAYYAAFLYVKEKLEELGYRFPDDHKVHGAVKDSLMEVNTTMGSQLDRLYEKRRTADYYMDTPLSMSEGIYCTNLSQRIIDNVEILKKK